MRTLHPGVHAACSPPAPGSQSVNSPTSIAVRLVVELLHPFIKTLPRLPRPMMCRADRIGDPAMVPPRPRTTERRNRRAALVDPAVIDAVASGGTSLGQRRELAARAFAHTAAYDSAVATWFAEGTLAEGEVSRVI